jgi:primosomal protein N' (replication factor Y) (superfamily II helicase)
VIADVALPLFGIEEALSYRVPVALEAGVRAGVRVVVPVERRHVVGLVVQVRDRYDGPHDLKAVERVLDTTPVVTQGQLELSRFVQRYYAERIGACVHLVLPPDADRTVERRFQLTDKGERGRVFGAALGLSAADVLVLARFGPGERKDERQLARSASARARLDKLVQGGFVEQVESREPTGALHVDEQLRALEGGQPIPSRQSALAAFDAWVRAFTAQDGRPPTLVEAAAAHADARGKANKLAALGRIAKDSVPRAQDTLGDLRAARVRALTDAQRSAADAVVRALELKDATAFLLEGVTGSGKTEVYLEALRACLERGRTALFLVPEIGLTPQLVARVRSALPEGEDVALLHSGLAVGERATALARVREGLTRVVVGARSALFAPLDKLGLIVVDEEHDGSLKQDESPRYHARDVALWLAKDRGAVCVLGSATPSLESRHNVEHRKLVHLELPTRFGAGGAMPAIEIVDLRTRGQVPAQRERDRQNVDEGPGVVLSGPLVTAIGETLADGDQVLLFLNKRGYASALFCEQCGHVEKCPSCSVSLTYHKRKGVLLCHQCDHEKLVPPTCSDCGTAGLLLLGTGTERLESELSARFPDAKLVRLDRDAVQRKGQLQKTLEDIHQKRVDIVVGTQMIAKGHDFPHVRTVGIVLADLTLALPDFRASERAFSLLLQVAGRAGRAQKRGRVVVQTYDPEHPALKALVTHDVKGFAAQELLEREKLFYPPYSRALLVRVEAEDAGDARRLAERVGKIARAAAVEGTRVVGPAPCALERLRNRTRMQVLVRAPTVSDRGRVVLALKIAPDLHAELAKRKARMILDLDPIHML